MRLPTNCHVASLKVGYPGFSTMACWIAWPPQLVMKIIETGCQKVLLDFSRSRISMSTMMIYKTPERLANAFAAQGINIHQVKRAVLIAGDDPDFRFLEDVTRNRGQNFKVFTEEDEAVRWLVEGEG